MAACEQTSGLSVLDHGHSVHEYFLDLRKHIMEGAPLEKEWRMPEWSSEPVLWERIGELVTDVELSNYQIYHDCGKPFCLTVDNEGRRHFPGHAEKSAETWLENGGSEIESKLMLHDMDIHLMKSKDFEAFKNLDVAAVLLLTGLAEIHSNAEMFGGIQSTSFKIKWKSLNKFGKRYVNLLVGGEV